MNTSSLSFDSSPQQKGALSTASGYLNKACVIGTVASFVAPGVAPLAGAVCVASKVTGAISSW